MEKLKRSDLMAERKVYYTNGTGTLPADKGYLPRAKLKETFGSGEIKLVKEWSRMRGGVKYPRIKSKKIMVY